MPDAMQILAASVVFGLANGLHCAGMCGPLAAVLQGGPSPSSAGSKATLASYHAGRIAAYVIAGLLCGLLGSAVLPERFGNALACLSLAFGIALLAMTFGLEHFLRLPGIGLLSKRASRLVLRLPIGARGFAIGACSPLLPCGLSLAVYGSAVVTANAAYGALTLFGFAVGSAALLLFAQVYLEWLRLRLGPRGMRRLSRASMLVVASMLIWRGYHALQGVPCCHV